VWFLWQKVYLQMVIGSKPIELLGHCTYEDVRTARACQKQAYELGKPGMHAEECFPWAWGTFFPHFKNVNEQAAIC
jgi:hypothetical protein